MVAKKTFVFVIVHKDILSLLSLSNYEFHRMFICNSSGTARMCE